MGAPEALSPPNAPALGSLAALPDPYGFAGMFAGVSGGALLCAGGANFPQKPLVQGGPKIWHDRVFALAAPGGDWGEAGRLPRATGYGVSATWRDAVVLVGGGDAQKNFREGFLMRWNGQRLAFESLPLLPVASANACGALVGDVLYVAGGQSEVTGTNTLQRCFSLDLSAHPRAWTEVVWPDEAPGRILAVAGACDGWFYLFSGTDLFRNAAGLTERRYLRDAWRFRPDTGWQRLADLPHAVAAAPSPALDAPISTLMIVGGVSPEFLSALPKNSPHPGFPGELLAYDIRSNLWRKIITRANAAPVPSRVTAPVTVWKERCVIPSGEISPGIRTPSILTYSFPL